MPGLSLSLFLYRVALGIAAPGIALYLLWRARRQPAYRHHWAERWGWAFPARAPRRPLLWIHAVSVGETRAAEPLIAAVRQACPQLQLLLTHMTPTGRAVPLATPGVLRCYLPYDYPGAMRRFMRHFQPEASVLLETEVWPNLVAVARQCGVPVMLVNARLSQRSLTRGQGRLVRRLTHDAMAGLTEVLAQTEADAARLRSAGVPAVSVVGNLKFDMQLAPEALAQGARLRALAAGRPVLLLASTREGEEALILDAWARAAGLPADLLLILVPRHPQRFDAVAQLLLDRGIAMQRRSTLDLGSANPPLASATQVLLGDSMGEMPAYYAAADLAYVGGSLLPLGGQNLIEACLVGCPVLLGVHTFNFAQASADAVTAGAALQVADADALLATAARLLADAPSRLAMAAAGRAFASQHSGATVRTLAALLPLLKDGHAAS